MYLNSSDKDGIDFLENLKNKVHFFVLVNGYF